MSRRYVPIVRDENNDPLEGLFILAFWVIVMGGFWKLGCYLISLIKMVF